MRSYVNPINFSVMPEVLSRASSSFSAWIPAFAGMTNVVALLMNFFVNIIFCLLSTLFIPQRIYRIKQRGLVCRIKPEKYSNKPGKTKGQ